MAKRNYSFNSSCFEHNFTAIEVAQTATKTFDYRSSQELVDQTFVTTVFVNLIASVVELVAKVV
tara:strand:- start:301 stop:492 length:192 start_codon:yes stop_codon:yes gene_type:complete